MIQFGNIQRRKNLSIAIQRFVDLRITVFTKASFIKLYFVQNVCLPQRFDRIEKHLCNGKNFSMEISDDITQHRVVCKLKSGRGNSSACYNKWFFNFQY